MTKARDIADSELGSLTVDTDTLVVDETNNRVGIGTSSPDQALHVDHTGTSGIKVSSNGTAGLTMEADSDGNQGGPHSWEMAAVGSGNNLSSRLNGSELMRIDSSGSLLVGVTSTHSSPNGSIATATLTGVKNTIQEGPRLTARVSDNNGGRVGGVGVIRTPGTGGGTTSGAGVGMYISSNTFEGYTQTYDNDLGFYFFHKGLYPQLDDLPDVGGPSNRWNDVYATNGTIQTSDRNEKQDIEALSEAEQRVAIACKGLMRKFRWKSAVEEKGDDARIHFGIIAQDLQDAFAAEGLDAGRYAMFISNTWWEAEETYTDDDGVEQTRTNTYDTQEDAPEGAIERTRMGVRYPELLAFIIAAI